MKLEEFVEVAINHMDNKEYAMAVAFLESVMQIPEFKESQKKHEVYHSLGVCFLFLKNYDEAVSALTASVKLFPQPQTTADYVLLADTHHFISKAYEEKSAYGKHSLPLAGGGIACH